MFVLAVAMPRIKMLPLTLAFLSLFLLATTLSQAGRLSESLSVFRGRPLEIRVWGKPLDSQCSIDSIRAIGAGLHLFVRLGDGPPRHLKVAQPRGATIDERSAEIAEAAYVQWAGRKVPRVAGAPALTIAAP